MNDYEQMRILEFFKHSPENEKKLISIAKTITKNTLTHLAVNGNKSVFTCKCNKSINLLFVVFFLDAYKIILLHSESVSTILNRKAISKELLLKYLTDCNVPVTNNFTKTTLVEQVIEFWKRTENVAVAHGSVTNHSDAENLTTGSIAKSENYPINIMSRNFSSWFYKNLNESSIQLNDFWTDCTCTIRMIDSSGEIKEDATITSRLVLNLLYTIKNQFNFFFNPNISHEGKLCQTYHL